MLCEFPKSDVVQEKDVTTFKKFRLQSLFITITEIRIYYLSHLFITLLFILLYIINNNYKMKDISCYYYSSYFIYNLVEKFIYKVFNDFRRKSNYMLY